MSVPRTRSTKDKPSLTDHTPKSRWKSLATHGVDPGEIYGHTISYHAASESLYLFGGSSRTGTFHNNVIRFHLPTQRWEVVDAQGKRPKGRHFHSAVILDHNLWVFGGKCNGYMNDLNCLNLVTCEWLELEKAEGSIPSRRYGHSMVLHNRNFYMYGGYDDFGLKCNDMYEYRPTANKWARVKTLGEAPERYHHSAVAHAGSMYLFGGNAGDASTSNSLFEYRFGTATWTKIATQNKSPESRWGHSSFIHDNQLYIIGGCDNILCFKDVYRISLESLAWKKAKKVSGFDPRYFGGCVLLTSDWPSCTYDPEIHDPKLPECSSNTDDDTSGVVTNSTISSSPFCGTGVTVIHHSAAVVAATTGQATQRAAPQPGVMAMGATNLTSNLTAPQNGPVVPVRPVVAPSPPSSSSSQPLAPTPPLPAITTTSPLPQSEHLGLGVKVLYHGGRNIHNWAFGDVLALSLEGEDMYDPFKAQMANLIGNKDLSDMAFRFPNEPHLPDIHAHKAILAIRCEPFAKMFSLGMAESSIGIVEIVDTPQAIFRIFLTFIYTGVLPAIDGLQENLQMLLLADKYFLHHLKALCEQRLKTFITTSSLTLIWDTAHSAHASSLQRSCIRFVTRFSDALMTSAARKSLPKSLLIEAKARLAQLNNSSN